MYDELVKRLRAQAVYLPEKFSKNAELLDALMKAADAIEELTADCDMYRKCMTDEHNKAARLLWDKEHCWIPVTERLPEKMQYVLVRYQNNDMAVASWFGGDEHIRFWRAMADEGWCADCDTEPTHWMPLPQPPKEE